MPTYEYVCKCGAEFEELQSIKAEPVAKCPECGRTAKRVVSAGAGLIFKGSGFYITDYKKNGANGGNGKSGKPASESTTGESSDKKAESGSGAKGKEAKSASEASSAKPSPTPAKT